MHYHNNYVVKGCSYVKTWYRLRMLHWRLILLQKSACCTPVSIWLTVDLPQHGNHNNLGGYYRVNFALLCMSSENTCSLICPGRTFELMMHMLKWLDPQYSGSDHFPYKVTVAKYFIYNMFAVFWCYLPAFGGFMCSCYYPCMHSPS